MSEPALPSRNILMDEIREIALDVANYAGRYTGNETFLGYNLREGSPLFPEHEESIPPEGMVKIVFEHWGLVSDRRNYGTNESYPDPETIDHRVMSCVVSATALLDYEKCSNGGYDPGDPNGDFEVINWCDDGVSDGGVPNDVVEALCEFLRNEREDYLYEEFEEAFKKGELPEWDPRITKVVDDVCRECVLREEKYEAMLAAETPEQRKLREGRFSASLRMVSGSWIGKEIEDTLARIKFYKELSDRTEDPEERKCFQDQMDKMMEDEMVREADVAQSEMNNQEPKKMNHEEETASSLPGHAHDATREKRYL
jgi:hypothetical protein